MPGPEIELWIQLMPAPRTGPGPGLRLKAVERIVDCPAGEVSMVLVDDCRMVTCASDEESRARRRMAVKL